MTTMLGLPVSERFNSWLKHQEVIRPRLRGHRGECQCLKSFAQPQPPSEIHNLATLNMIFSL